MHTVQIGKEWFSEESGGLNRYFAELVKHLPPLGVGVTGLVAGTGEVAARSAGTVHAFAPRGASLPVRLAGARRHARRALADRPDGLVAAHFALYTAPCLDLVRDHPLVVHFHGPWADESRAEGGGALAVRVKHWLEHQVYTRAMRLIVLSQAFAGVLEAGHLATRDRIRVIPGGVDIPRFRPSSTREEARHRLGWPIDRPIVLVVRRLVRRMGLEALVAGIRHTRRLSPDVLVLVAGRGPLAGELGARIAAEDAVDHVKLLGYLPDEDLPVAYRAADLSVVPSASLEGFGLIVVESLASGTPALVTAVGGLPETLQDFAPQCIVRDFDPRALGTAIGEALSGTLPLPSPEDCTAYANARFAWPAIAARVRDVYAEALS